MSKMLMPFTGMIAFLLLSLAAIGYFEFPWWSAILPSIMLIFSVWVGAVRTIEYRRLHKIMRFIYPEDAISSTIKKTITFAGMRVIEMAKQGLALRSGRFGFGQRRVYAHVVADVSHCSLSQAYGMWDSHVKTLSMFSLPWPLSLRERFFSPHNFEINWF